MKQVLKMFLSKTIGPSEIYEGTVETIINQRIEKEVLTKDELDELNDKFGDDYECAYHEYGLCYDINEELNIIILDKLAEGLTSYLKEEDPEEEETLRGILAKVKPLRKYDLDFETEIKEG